MNKIRYELILEILRRKNKITPPVFDDSLEVLRGDKDPLDELLKNDVISKTDILEAFNEYFNSPMVDLDSVEINIDFSSLLGLDLLRRYHFIPLYRFTDGLFLISCTNEE